MKMSGMRKGGDQTMIKVIYETPTSRFACTYETMQAAIDDISAKEELGWKAEEVQEVKR